MIEPKSDEFSVELLAAYADGELDGAARAGVEQWLADHPEALADLLAQQELSAANASLWDGVEPPEPADQAWHLVRQGIENGLNPAVPVQMGNPRVWRAALWVLGGLSMAGLAAAVGWLAFGPTAPPAQQLLQDNRNPVEVVQTQPVTSGPEIAPAPRPVTSVPSRSADPLDGIAVLPMPSDNDVILDRVPALRTGWLPVGQHPIPGSLVLAASDEVHLEEVEPSAIWPTGGPRMTTAPGDAPMIFAAKLR